MSQSTSIEVNDDGIAINVSGDESVTMANILKMTHALEHMVLRMYPVPFFTYVEPAMRQTSVQLMLPRLDGRGRMTMAGALAAELDHVMRTNGIRPEAMIHPAAPVDPTDEQLAAWASIQTDPSVVAILNRFRSNP